MSLKVEKEILCLSNGTRGKNVLGGKPLRSGPATNQRKDLAPIVNKGIFL
jgi:hypothetical protein